MANTVTMPKLGHLMEEGTVVRWHKRVGERVERGEVLLEVGMEKSVLEVEAFVSGTLEAILVGEEQTVPVGTPIAVVAEAGEGS
jgi:pyruvate dehydrogenase E2 component (dihydrolipoamide acetyltransferase)